jgi:riboflavin-specific deaminase-like protein
MPSVRDDEKHSKFSGIPFVTVKFAQSLDGRIATATGDSKWITGEEARQFAHQLRSRHDAILVGIGTVLADDPQLTVRLTEGRDPLRVVVDTNLRTPLTARVLANGAAAGTLIVCAESVDRERVEAVEELGGAVLRLAANDDQAGIDIARLLEALGRRGIKSVLVEGGRQIITAFLSARAVDRVIAIVAPKIIGKGIESIGDLGIIHINDALTFTSVSTLKLGADIVFDARLK